MDIVNIPFGLFMIGIGFLVKFNPDLIAGYNTLSESDKQNVDIEGLSTFARNAFIAMGLIIIAGHFLFVWLGYTQVVCFISFIVSIIGLPILVILAKRFNKMNECDSK